MAHEFIARKGLIALDDSQITGSLVVTGDVTASVVSASYIDFDSISQGNEPSWKEGRVFYSAEDGALSVYNSEADITLQVGQEFWKKAKNGSGSPIPNGTPVRVSGSTGGNPLVFPALAEDHTSEFDYENHIIGVATHEIGTNAVGFVTEKGIVNDIDTSGFAAGDTIYLQTGSAGFRNTPPPFPYDIVTVGTVLTSHATEGKIEVNPLRPIHFGVISGLSGSVSGPGDLWVYQSNGAWTPSKTLSGSYTIDSGDLSVTGSVYTTEDVWVGEAGGFKSSQPSTAGPTSGSYYDQKLEFYIPYRTDGTTIGENRSAIKLGGQPFFEPRTQNGSTMYVFSSMGFKRTDGTGTGISISLGNTGTYPENTVVMSSWASFKNTSDRYFQVYGYFGHKFAINGAEVMRVNSTGLGINTTSPSAKLHIKGANDLSGNYALKVQNSSSVDILTVENDGKLYLSNPIHNSGDINSTGSFVHYGDLTLGPITSNAPDRKVTIGGYNNAQMEFDLHNGWGKPTMAASYGGTLKFVNYGIQSTNLNFQFGESATRQGSMRFYTDSDEAIKFGTNGGYPLAYIGVVEQPNNYNGGLVIKSRNGTSIINTWTFGRYGDLTTPGDVIVTGSVDVSGSLTIGGDLTIDSTGDYLVGANRYAFRYSGDPDAGLYFNTSAAKYQFRDLSANAVFSIGATNGNTEIGGVLSIPGFSDVSASLATAIAGDNLGNHTATQNLDMGGNAITNVGNVDGVDVSTLNSTVSTNTSNIATLTAATGSYLTTVDISDDTNLTAGTGITLTGDTLSTNDSQIIHDNLSGFVANEHINHTSVSITAGNGLTGGGTIAATRTLNVGAGDGISVTADSVAVDATVLRTTGDGVISSSAQVDHDQTANFSADEHFTQANITTVGTVTSGDVSAILPAGTISSSVQITITESQISDLNHYTDSDVKSKLNTENVVSGSATQVRTFLNVEDGADVTDTANVTAAGGLMDSEVDADIKTLSLPANTTISTFAQTFLDDTTAAAVRTTLDVDQAGTDNSTDVTLAGSYDYITISGQQITRNQIDLSTDVTGQITTSSITNFPTEVSRSAAAAGFGAGGGSGISFNGSTANGLLTYGDSTTADVESNLTFDGSTLTVTGNVTATSLTGSLDATNIDPSNLVGGTDNTVVIVNNGTELRTDEIDSRVWGSTLVDATNGSAQRIAVFTDSNSVEGDANFTFDGTFLDFNSTDYGTHRGIAHDVETGFETPTFTTRGEYLYLSGSITTTAGKLYNLSGSMDTADAKFVSDSTGFMAMGIENSTSNRYLINGIAIIPLSNFGGNYIQGASVYAGSSTNSLQGKYTFSPDTTSGAVARIVGHALDTFDDRGTLYVKLRFNPSNDWVEYA